MSLIAEDAAETLLPLAEKHGITIETFGSITPASGSYALLLQMTTNLLHNAIVHNLPEHGTVQVTSAVCPEGVRLTVQNTGEMINPRCPSPRSPNRSSADPIAPTSTTQVWVSALPSSRASCTHTMEP